MQDQVFAVKNELCFYRDKQGIKGLAAPFPCTPNPAEAPPLRSGTTLIPSDGPLTNPNTFRHNQLASVASLRRLFAFTGMPFGFPLESPFTFTGIPTRFTALSTAPSPRRILGDHAENQLAHFPAQGFPSGGVSSPRQPRPVQPKSNAMPTHHRFWGDEQKRFLPPRPKLSKSDPEHLVQRAQSSPRSFGTES